MQTFSKFLANTLASLFAILFVITTVLAFALYNVEQSAFDAELYRQALIEENAYQRLPEIAAHLLAEAAQQPERKDELALFRNLSEEDWRVFVSQLLPPDELKFIVEDATTQLLGYLNWENETVTLSLASLKTHLASPEGVAAIYAMLKTQPDCTVEQLTAMAMGLQELALCNPPETFLFIDLRPVVEAEIKAAVSLVPDQVTVISPGDAQPQNLQDLKTFRIVMRLSPLAPVLCLLIITVLVVRSLGDWLAWWGYPFLIGGAVSMLIGAISKPLAAWLFGYAISPLLPQTLPVDIVTLFRDLMAAIVQNALQPVVGQAGVVALVGLVMAALAIIVRVMGKRFRKRGKLDSR